MNITVKSTTRGGSHVDNRSLIYNSPPPHDRMGGGKKRKTMKEFVLLKDIDWFGKLIPSGIIYRQVNADYYQPMINGARCPSLQIDFYTVLNNPQYFLEIRN